MSGDPQDESSAPPHNDRSDVGALRVEINNLIAETRRLRTKYAKEVREEEREACARLADIAGHAVAQGIAASIRARGEESPTREGHPELSPDSAIDAKFSGGTFCRCPPR